MRFIFPLLWLLLALAPPALADFNCQGDPFIGTTVLGKTLDKAREKAKAEIARNIISNVKSKIETADYGEEKDGIFKESSRYLEKSRIESELTILGFKEAEAPKRVENGEYELKAYVCVKDVAKPYLEKQRILAENMEISKDWHKIQSSWNEFMGIQIMLESLGAESKYFAKAEMQYEKARDDHKASCTAKLHWNPENKTAYSDIAFAKLSEVGMETSECEGRGIKLAYNGAEAKCRKAGMHQCIHKPSLAISSCKDEKHRLLEGEEIKVYEKTEEAALETLQESLRNGTFWNKWEQEIKQWRPKCD